MAFHPWAALRHLSRIAGSRLHSVPVTVMDWEGAPDKVRELAAVPGEVMEERVLLAAPVEVDGGRTQEDAEEEVSTPAKTGRSPVPDELYLAALEKLVEGNDGVIPSAREVARKLSIGQDRARRLLTALKDEQTDDAEPDTIG